MKRPSISLCIIVKNEEHNLPRLLKSVEGCFDEICITDTGSTDKTVEIAESFVKKRKDKEKEWKEKEISLENEKRKKALEMI